MDRYMIISADGHAGVPDGGYRQYMESQYHDGYDDYLKGYLPGAQAHRKSLENLGERSSARR